MKSRRSLSSLKILVVCGLWWITTAFASTQSTQPNVVVSIAPFHALVSAVMENVGEPKLLVGKGASPHHYNLRPSEIKTLEEANIVFWAGPELETFLVKPLQSLGSATKIVQLDKTDKLLLLPPRRKASFQTTKAETLKKEKTDESHPDTHQQHRHTSTDGCCGHDHDSQSIDMHFWLDPNNAKLMIGSIVENLSAVDPEHKAQYRANAKKFIKKLETVDRQLKIKLKPIQKMPYIVFHDAYQYFEKHYHLTGVGTISIHPELPLSLQRLYEVRDTIKKTKAICIFREPQFQSKLVENLAQETGVRVGELDPLGRATSQVGDDYFILLENIANSLEGCLTK